MKSAIPTHNSETNFFVGEIVNNKDNLCSGELGKANMKH